MATSSPFLLFDGDCAEAMGFYHRCLGGELELMPLGETPMKEAFPPETHDRTIYARLVAGGIDISAADWMAADSEPVLGNRSAIYITGDDSELPAIFDTLRDGDNNTFLQELHAMPFGLYGQFYDRYGVQWIFRGAADA